MVQELVYGRRVKKVSDLDDEELNRCFVPDDYTGGSDYYKAFDRSYLVETFPESGVFKPFILPDIGEEGTQELLSMIGEAMDAFQEFRYPRMTPSQTAAVEAARQSIKLAASAAI